jgi:hypothetical protein
MTLKDTIGLVFAVVGVGATMLGYRILPMRWYAGACLLLFVGVLLMWSARRDRKMQEALVDLQGDWDGDFLSGPGALDGIDAGGD